MLLYLDLIIQILLFVLFLFIVCFSLLLPQTHSGPTFVHLKRKRKSIYISNLKLQKNNRQITRLPLFGVCILHPFPPRAAVFPIRYSVVSILFQKHLYPPHPPKILENTLRSENEQILLFSICTRCKFND